MTEIIIVASTSFDRRDKRRHGRFDVRLQGCDEIICAATQQPLLDASRVLLRRGYDPSTVICKVRSDAPTVVTMRAPISVASQCDVMGEKFVRRKPVAVPMPSSEIKLGGSAEPRVRGSTEGNAGGPHNGSSRASSTSSRATSPKSPVTQSHPKRN